MLGKLMKYELRATARTMLPGFAAVIVLAGLTRLSAELLMSRGDFLTLVNGLSRACTALALQLGGVLATTVGARAAYVIVGVAGLAVAMGAAMARRRVSVRRDLANPALVDLPAAGQAH